MKKEKNILVGKWRMVCWKVNAVGGWKLLKKFIENQYLWDFRVDGKLDESIAGKPLQEIDYSFPANDLLLITRPENEGDDKITSTIDERYRVELLTERYAILYDLEGVPVIIR